MLPPNATNAATVFPIGICFIATPIYESHMGCMRNIGNEHEVSHCGNLNVVITPHVKYMRNGNDNLPIHVSYRKA